LLRAGPIRPFGLGSPGLHERTAPGGGEDGTANLPAKPVYRMNASNFPRKHADSDRVRAALPDSAANVFAPSSHTFSPDDYAVGQVLSGRFRVEHVIGVGSMGVVLAARHLELDERVAIKFIRAEMQKVPGVLSRFAREAKALVSIKSEHVAQVFDVGTADGIGPYIVMEYLEGRDLGAVLELEGRLPIRRAVHYVMQACEALAVAHSINITHRDIKPENLFLTRQGDLELVKLLDFGISKATLTGKVFGDELSAAESECLLGTPLYMSPEQIRATAQVDHRTDIWSLGAVLYELITARSAFVADSVHQVWTRILETAPTSLAAYCPEAPPGLQLVIDRCLEKDPARRYQNVAELAMALLPFAPSRARAYAQRASSILGTKSDSIFPAPMPSAHPGALSGNPSAGSSRPSASLEPIPQRAILALPIPDFSAPPVFAHNSTGFGPPRQSRLIPAVFMAALFGAVFVIWLGTRRGGPDAFGGAPRVTRVEEAALSGAQPPSEAELSLSRTVLVESQPSGALVKLGGQPLGVTPLSTILPVGTQELSLSKPGYASELAFVQLDAAPPSAKAVRTRVVLTPSSSESPTARRAPPPRPSNRRTARKSPPAEVARNEAPAAVPIVPEPAIETLPRVEPAPSTPLLTETPRARLVDEPSRPRLLD
jgi:serine/threonine protein kinase